MQLYLDTEFNGFGGQLISLALVPADGGEEFYSAAELPVEINSWVREHVIPLLGIGCLPYQTLRRHFHGYVRCYHNPTIICDWHADAEHFCRLLAGDDYGSSLDFSCNVRILKTPPGQPVSKVPHNALEDARALKRWHQSLSEAERAA